MALIGKNGNPVEPPQQVQDKSKNQVSLCAQQWV